MFRIEILEILRGISSSRAPSPLPEVALAQDGEGRSHGERQLAAEQRLQHRRRGSRGAFATAHAEPDRCAGRHGFQATAKTLRYLPPPGE